jgi:hypothetical protein
MLFVLHGKNNPPSIKMFALRMKKSERTVSRLYEELKEKNFLKIECLKPKVYRYFFDPNGNVNFEKPVETEETVREFEEKEQEEMYSYKETKVSEQEEVKEKENLIIEKAKTIQEYEDFAILENFFWELNGKEREKIILIIEERIEKEANLKEVLSWFLQKVKYV